MEAIPIKFSISQILALTRQLPKEVKALLIKEWSKELKEGMEFPATLDIEGYDEPFDLDNAALRKSELQKLQNLWEDEPTAEELVKMLTP